MFAGKMARHINDLILSSGNPDKHHAASKMEYMLIENVNGDNQSNRSSFFDYKKIPVYFQIVFPENKTCVRFFISPHYDGNVFYGYYENYDAVKDNKFKPSTIAFEEAFTQVSAFNNSVVLIRIIDFLLYKTINHTVDESSIVFH